MHRQILEACLPFATLLVVAFGVLHLTVRLSRANWEWRRLKQLHRDQVGGVQSLAFVLTMPVFIMVVSLIVQVSQLMLGMIGVHYAAYAGARAASVWVPAHSVPREAGQTEFPNHVSDLRLLYQDRPFPGEQSRGFLGPTSLQTSTKYQKTWIATVMALAPFGTIYDWDQGTPGQVYPGMLQMRNIFANYYLSQSPTADPNKLQAHIDRRLAWVEQNTLVFLEWRDAQRESGRQHLILEGPTYNPRDHEIVLTEIGPHVYVPFERNEVGWQDPLTVHVYYRFPLMPGFGKFLQKVQRSWPFARDHMNSQLVSSSEWERIVNQESDGVIPGAYVIHASATMNNDGLIPIYGEGVYEY